MTAPNQRLYGVVVCLLFIGGCLMVGFGDGEMKAVGACVLCYLIGRADGRANRHGGRVGS